jgi:hypothetical protein
MPNWYLPVMIQACAASLSSPRGMMRAGTGRDLQAQVAAGAGVLDAVMLQDSHLLWNDVHLLADLGADLHQRVAVMGAHAIGLGQLVANDLTRQRWIQGLASALLALVPGHQCRIFFVGLGWWCLIGRRECFSLVEEHVLLFAAARFALGGEELALQGPQPLDCQVPLGGHDAQFADERFAAPSGLGQGLLQGCEFFGGGHLNHRLLRST